MAAHLDPLDAIFLELEELDDGSHMHIGGAAIFDPPAGGRPPTLEQLRDLVGRRRPGRMDLFEKRLSEPQTGGLRWPSWEDGPGEEGLRDHVRHATLPEPGGEPELLDWLGDYWSHRLDRHRPLWELVLLDGLEGGRWALVNKTHHAMVDGVGSVDIGHVLLDAEPEPATRRSPRRSRSRAPSPRTTRTRRSCAC